MKKEDLVQSVAKKTGLTKKDSAVAVNAVFDAIQEGLVAGEEINFVGFGKFTVKARPAREGVNPAKPGEKIQIAASKVPSFKAGKALKDAVNV